MKEFMLLLLFCQVTSPVTHILKYFYTASSEVPNFPEFVIVGMVDDVQMVYYDSNTQRVVVKQDWMSQVTTDDPQYLERNTLTAVGAQEVFKNNMDIAKQRFNQTGGVHIVQWMYGCEWDDETGDSDGYNQYGYDGEDFLSFDLKRETWVAAKPQAFITKQRWDQDKAGLAHLKHYFNSVCIEWLKKHVNYGKKTQERTELPSISFLQKTPSSPVRCHATGFYPDRAIMFWAKDGEELQENVDHGELLPNNDGTFQMTVDLNVCSVEDSQWKLYECVFQLYGVKEDINTRLDRDLIKTNWGKPRKVLFKPDIIFYPSINGISEGQQQQEQQVLEGSNFNISCSIHPQKEGGSFHLTFTGSNTTHNHTQPAVNQSANFLFLAADHTHQGNYSCVYHMLFISYYFSYESELLSLTVTGLFEPIITFFPSKNVSEGQQQWIFNGSSFVITCSIQPQYPGGSFHLTFTGSNTTENQPAVSHSANFMFPVADHKHEGNYSCIYLINGFNQNFSSESELLYLTVTDITTASHLTETILKASGIVLMLLIGMLLIRGNYSLWKVIRRQGAAVGDNEMDYVNVAGSRAEARQREQVGVQARVENIEMDYVNDAASRAEARLSKEAGVQAGAENIEMDYVNDAASMAEARQREQARVHEGVENIETDYVNDTGSRG